jgi:hypothetical protein
MTTYAGQSALNRDHLVDRVSFATATVECHCGWVGLANADLPAVPGQRAGFGWAQPPAKAGTPQAVKRMFSQHRSAMGLRSNDGTSTIEGFGLGSGVVLMPGWRRRIGIAGR